MANESMNMKEGFSAHVVKGDGGTTPEPKTRHYIIGWAIILAILAGAILFVAGAFAAGDDMALGESLQAKAISPLVRVTPRVKQHQHQQQKPQPKPERGTK